MDDERIWQFEESLWTGDAANYHEKIDDQCLMALPRPPYLFTGKQAADAVSDTPRWSQVAFSGQQVARPQEGVIAIAYHARASRDGETYEAHCTTVMHRIEHEVWRVIQHGQTPPLAAPAEG